MACDAWSGKLDLYVDGELAPAEANALSAHMRDCPGCATDVLEKVQMKRSLATAGKRYVPGEDLRMRIAQTVAAKTVAAKPPKTIAWWKVVAGPAIFVLLISLAMNLYVGRKTAQRQRVYSELADLHIAALASTTPVDVLSTDRHTVKPWFQGKIPFTFNLPELQGSEFTLLGGRVTYLGQTPGAHLIYQVRKHEISVFIFQDRGDETASLASEPIRALSFNMENWTQGGLRYFVVGDVSPDDIQALSKLLRSAG
jgi:anti-sigma factor RsiW